MRWLPRLWLALLALALAGCAGYRLGSTAGFPAGSRSIQIRPFANQTPEPRLSEAVSHALRKRLQQDGTYRLNSQGDADVLVQGSLVEFNRAGLSYQPSDVITIRDFNLSLTAEIEARERLSGKILFRGRVAGQTTLRAQGDQASIERQALPLLAEDLARNIASLLVSGSW